MFLEISNCKDVRLRKGVACDNRRYVECRVVDSTKCTMSSVQLETAAVVLTCEL